MIRLKAIQFLAELQFASYIVKLTIDSVFSFLIHFESESLTKSWTCFRNKILVCIACETPTPLVRFMMTSLPCGACILYGWPHSICDISEDISAIFSLSYSISINTKIFCIIALVIKSLCEGGLVTL